MIRLPEFIEVPDPNIYWSENYIVLDFETTNLDKGDPINANNRILYCGYTTRSRTSSSNTNSSSGREYHCFSPQNAKELEKFLRELERVDFFVAHNAKFELGWLKRMGVRLERRVVFCTQLAEYVLLGNYRKKEGLSLDASLQRRELQSKESVIQAMMKSGTCPSEMPDHWLREYLERDVKGCEELFLDQRKELFDTGQEKVFYTKCLQSPVLADIEFNGMKLDKKLVQEKYYDYTEKLRKIEQELAEITGGINPNSPKQLAEFIYDTLGFDEPKDPRGNPIRTPTGERSASKAAISRLTPNNKRQRRFLELKKEQGKLNAALTKALDKFYDCVTQTDNGILYAGINQTVTATGRYSSTGKNYSCQFQNIAREFKSLFRARKTGWFLGEADESQLEFRTAVWYGQDKQGFSDIEHDVDIHSYTAEIIGCSRQDAKPHTFKPLYGGTSGTPNEKRYYRAFKKKYSGITREQDRWVDEALETKELTLPTGQKFYFPHIRMTKTGYIEYNTAVRDYPVQYLATAEIVPIALIYVWHALKQRKMESFIVNTVHDSIIAEINPEEIELFRETSVQGMKDFPVKYMRKLYGIDFNVPLETEIKIGTHWSEDNYANS